MKVIYDTFALLTQTKQLMDCIIAIRLKNEYHMHTSSFNESSNNFNNNNNKKGLTFRGAVKKVGKTIKSLKGLGWSKNNVNDDKGDQNHFDNIKSNDNNNSNNDRGLKLNYQQKRQTYEQISNQKFLVGFDCMIIIINIIIIVMAITLKQEIVANMFLYHHILLLILNMMILSII